jgi:hypothetical protein
MPDFKQSVDHGQTPAALWWSLVAGFIAWGCDLGFSYALDQHACSTGHTYVMHVISIVCFLIALSGFALGWMEFRRVPPEADDEGERPLDRAHFQVLLGMGFSLAFAVVVIAGAVPRWILSPCH